MRIALGQLKSSPRKDETLAGALRAIREARRGGADLLLMPEVYMAFLDRSPGVARAPRDLRACVGPSRRAVRRAS